jgi:type I restriction enzyme, S subunit
MKKAPAPTEIEEQAERDDLPEGWACSTVGEIFLDVRNGTTATQNKDGRGVPVSRIETIQQSRFDLTRVGYLVGCP